MFLKHFSSIPDLDISNYFVKAAEEIDCKTKPLFLSVVIRLYLPDEQVASFDPTSADICHIRENYTNYIKGVLQFKWKGPFFMTPRHITVKNISKLSEE